MLLLNSIPHFLLSFFINKSFCTSGMRAQSSVKAQFPRCLAPSNIAHIALPRHGWLRKSPPNWKRWSAVAPIKDGHTASLLFHMRFTHGELGWHLQVRYLGDATSHNNNRVSRHNFAPYRHCIKSKWYSLLHVAARLIKGVFSTLITEMSVPCLHVSRAQQN